MLADDVIVAVSPDTGMHSAAAMIAALDSNAAKAGVKILIVDDGAQIEKPEPIEIRIPPQMPDHDAFVMRESVCNSNENWRNVFNRRGGRKYRNRKGKNRNRW